MELDDIIENATVITNSSILLSTKEHFFELYTNDEKLKIFSYIGDKESYINKAEFMKLYKSSDIQEIKHICVDE